MIRVDARLARTRAPTRRSPARESWRAGIWIPAAHPMSREFATPGGVGTQRRANANARLSSAYTFPTPGRVHCFPPPARAPATTLSLEFAPGAEFEFDAELAFAATTKRRECKRGPGTEGAVSRRRWAVRIEEAMRVGVGGVGPRRRPLFMPNVSDYTEVDLGGAMSETRRGCSTDWLLPDFYVGLASKEGRHIPWSAAYENVDNSLFWHQISKTDFILQANSGTPVSWGREPGNIQAY
ncbi:hypothetical protein B0H11DRAFT_1942481 [Mycena galericulata]|nr:hypothetical protein B0H11DRAFT_1942481 [Mycena galericulata]